MHILNLNTKTITKDIKEIDFNTGYYFVVCNPWELKFFKNHLNINNEIYKDCLYFDEKVKVNVLKKYIFFTLNNFQIVDEDILLEEINIFLSEQFIVVVLRKRNDLYKSIKRLMSDTSFYKTDLTLSLLIIYSSMFRLIISAQFENLEKVEDCILELEDYIINGINEDISIKISHLKSICRTCVKCIRPLTYIIDTLQKEGMEFFSDKNSTDISLERKYMKLMQGLDSSVDKLYDFALITRESAYKLFDIYNSKVSEKTNNLITKLTIVTGTAVPITIITGIYGMNFKYMPELNYIHGYKIALLVIILIPAISFIIFKIKKMI